MKTIEIIKEFFREDPKGFIEDIAGWACLFAMVVMLAGIGA